MLALLLPRGNVCEVGGFIVAPVVGAGGAFGAGGVAGCEVAGGVAVVVGHGRGAVAIGAAGGACGWCVEAVNRFDGGSGMDGFAVVETLAEFVARGVVLKDVDVHVFIGLADAAEAEGSRGT